MEQINYEEYEIINGNFSDNKKNFRIISLARRNKFYVDNIKNILNPSWSFNPKTYYIQIATIKKRNDYKIIGFIIYSFKSKWDYGDDKNSFSLEYWLVDKAFQNKGIGFKLYDIMKKEQEQLKIYNVNVFFKKDDKQLIDLYTKLGYKYIDSYDGVCQKQKDTDKHIKWWLIY